MVIYKCNKNVRKSPASPTTNFELKGRTIRKVMGGGAGEVQKKNHAREN